MAPDAHAPTVGIDFETHPDRYRHWRLAVDGNIATLTMAVELHGGLRSDYELKLNSYDLGVDIELADAVQRLRFEWPQVRAVVVRSGHERAFCAGANIPMLGTSSHAFKVNFCKFTNETRLYIEDASRHSALRFLAAVTGPCAGGGYELALACDEIVLVDDGNSAVSLPEVPLLGVLPGTGGLTRLVDKRRVRRDRADVFCTTAEGIKGKRALEWGLVDALAPRSRFDEVVRERARRLADEAAREAGTRGPGIALPALEVEREGDRWRWKHVTLEVDRAARVAHLTVEGPSGPQPRTAEQIQQAGGAQWSLQAFRELDRALLTLRFEYLDVGLVVVRTRGSLEPVLEVDRALHEARGHWLAREIVLHQARVLRRLDVTARSFFALAEPGSCFAGSLLELALAADRFYMLDDEDGRNAVAVSPLNAGALPMGSGLSRLQGRLYGDPAAVERVLGTGGPIAASQAVALGLATVAPDEIDWEDDVRIAIEERASLSPDALTGMEASLRFVGPETLETKIFGRLSAWQNWIFQRPNAVGPHGALTSYGKPDRPVFDWTRC
ncbi:MAG: 2,3-epoxybenzoyl-CoA dihydrolase [Myxococcota bacterium]|nr:2,3-epoxybenzoyl-CoA dihydrolase [Myxococcota bacterium]